MGWMIVGVSTAVCALAWSARSTFALFYVAILAAFPWGRGSAAFGYSLSWLAFVVFAPLAGWLSDRWGTRRVVALGGLLLGLALALTGGMTSLAQYYLCFGVVGAAGIACLVIPSTTIVTRWFVRSRGTAMGVLSIGNPLSAVIFYPLNAWLIAILGWRAALGAFGAIVAAASIVLALWFREPPRSAKTPDAVPASPCESWTASSALRSGRFWAAFIMTTLGTIGFQIVATHQVAHAVDRGFDQAAVVGLFAFGAACMMAGNLLGGWLSDRLGRGWVFAMGSLMAILGIACLAAVHDPRDLPLLVLYTVSGFGLGMRIAQLSTIPADVFSGPHLGAILGLVQAGGGLGGAAGPFLGGWLFDLTGSYRLAFVAAALSIAGSAVGAWLAARPGVGRDSTARSG